jgi:hypothetical protein
MYEELFYQSYTIQELERIVNDPAQLDGYRKRCKQELNKRNEQQQEITRL